MPIIRVHHIDERDLLESDIIVNPVSLIHTSKNCINKKLKKMFKKEYRTIDDAIKVNAIKGKKKRSEAMLSCLHRPITPTSFNTIVSQYDGKIKYISTIPYKKSKEMKSYLVTLAKFFEEAKTYSGVSIGIPLYGDSFGRLKKEVLSMAVNSGYPAYIDVYIDDTTKDLLLGM